ncbi:MAG: xanthine dehydrogenase FAD-binding subunit [Blastococcus sp.]|jgi:CO/xanthine dehydrogenase FAD-binding subunit|nr:xanthine dehydrogenase FAD-binding subunit [Blastococcus sp.]
MRPFAYARPGSLAEAFDLLDDAEPGNVRMIVGGTDLIVGLQSGKIAPRLVVDLKHLTDLPAGITEVDGAISISAPTTLTDVIADERIRTAFPALVEAASTVGSVQIRNRASLTGNICNASPAFDTATALLVHDAVVVLSSRAGDRRLPVADFVLGPRSTDLRKGEIATAVELPLPTVPTGTKFARLTRRRGVDLATLSLCCAVDAGRARFAFGAVAPRPFVVADDSGVLADPRAAAEDRDRALRALTAHARPISDLRAGQDYRQAMLLVLSRRAHEAALAALNGG